jgi:hypothetical protein
VLLEADTMPAPVRPYLLAAARFFGPSDDDPISDAWSAATA